MCKYLHSTLIKYKVMTAEQLERKAFLNLHSTLIKYKALTLTTSSPSVPDLHSTLIKYKGNISKIR